MSKRAKQLIMFLIICIVLITLLYDKNNIVMVLYITIGCISQYDLINILKTHNKISSRTKINIIVGSIILCILILLFSSKYLYNILQS